MGKIRLNEWKTFTKKLLNEDYDNWETIQQQLIDDEGWSLQDGELYMDYDNLGDIYVNQSYGDIIIKVFDGTGEEIYVKRFNWNNKSSKQISEEIWKYLYAFEENKGDIFERGGFDQYAPDEDEAMLKENKNLITEGQFSWMTQDTGRQIGSEDENTITVYMFDNEGNKWTEKNYEGYGEFGGKDYYELLAEMNGIENPSREDGIDLAFDKTKKDILFPALVEDEKFDWKNHDFTEAPDNDPNQSWYQEDEEEDYEQTEEW